jgi:UDP-glucose 4-epimerase
MKRYLVTGGCGFIGSHLVDALLAGNNRVRILDDLSTGTTAHLSGGAELIVGDVGDAQLVREALRDVNGCFHLAAVASVARCNQAWCEGHRVNLSATVGLFEAACGWDRRVPIVYASSAAAYGGHKTMPLTEDLPSWPLSPYGADKAGCELHARAGANIRGLASVGLRFFNVYGPRQRPDSPYSGVISIGSYQVSGW